jgi:hypothetical protein
MTPIFELKDVAGDTITLKRDSLERMTFVCITENTSHNKIIAAVMLDVQRLTQLRDAISERIKEME